MSERRQATKQFRPSDGNLRPDPRVLRTGPAQPIPDLLREFGVAPATVFARAGFDEALLANPDSRTGFEAVGRLLDECVTATGCPHFGLLVGERFSESTLGVVFQLMRHSATLGDALRQLVLYLHVHDRGGVPYLTYPGAHEVGVAYGIYQRGAFRVAPMYDASMAILVSMLRELCGPAWTATRVTFAHRRPADVTPYRRLFKAPLDFNAEHCSVVFSLRWLAEPVQGSDPALRTAFARLVTERESAEALSLADKVRRVLRTAVLAGTATADNVAFLFARSRRSLHRQLQAEGTSLQTLISETRFEVARQLLGESDMPASEIASALHYSDASAFSRAFKDWAGASPRQWRQAAQQGSRRAPRPGRKGG